MRMGLTSLLLSVIAFGGLACGDGNERPPPIGEDSGTCVDADDDGHALLGSCDGADDCDDANPAVRPGVADNPCADLNCDGIGGADEDADQHLDMECGGDDCDDHEALRNPSLPDVSGNAIDDNCDGVDGVDGDGDGTASVASAGTDCDDADAAVFPGATDQVGDTEDRDCDGVDGTDGDGDTFPSVASGGTDCDDRSAEVRPGAADAVGNAIDDDCDGVDGVDGDGDGYASETSGGDDCNDLDAAIHLFAQGDWEWELLTTALRGDAPSAALDSDGSVWVAYVEEDDFGTNQIVLANDAAGAWAFETVAPSPHCVALALDGSDGVHLVYRNALEFPQYATNASGDWVVEPIGGNAAIANCTVGVAPNGLVHTVFSTEALAVTHGHRAADDWFFEEVATGEVDTTDVSFQIDGRRVLHIAYSDAGVHYVSNATAGYAETNEELAGPGGTTPFALADGDTLIVSIDGGAAQTVTFETGDFVNIAAATASEVDAAITAQLAGALVTLGNGTVRITSGSVGTDSVVDIDVGSTAIAPEKLDMSSGSGGTHTGGVWIEESVDAGQTAMIALLGDVPAIVYQGEPRMFYAERDGDDSWTTIELPWDSVSPHLTFASDGYRHAVFGDVATGNVVWARSETGALWASEPVQPVAGTETVGRILMAPGDEPVFFVVEEIEDETSLYVVRRGPVDGVDQDCDGRIR